MAAVDWLPPLMEFNDYGGNWHAYEEALYAAFTTDFIVSKPRFRGRRLGLKRHPVIDGKEATFWHMTSEGAVESERIPDLRRCERIRWPRPVIEHDQDADVLVWEEPHRSHGNRIHLYLPNERYLVVLADRGKYILPWTAFYIQGNRSHEKYLKRHARYSKNS